MKLLTSLYAWAIAMSCLTASAQIQTSGDLLVNFRFQFAPGTVLTGQTETNGLTWAAAGPAGPQITIVSNSLAAPGLVSPTGNRARLAGINGPAARIGFGTNVTGGTLFYSLALRVADLGTLGTNGGTLVAFNNATGTSPDLPLPLAARLLVRSNGAGYQLGLSATSADANNFVWHPTILQLDGSSKDTAYIVASYEFVEGPGNDIARFWVNPSPASFGESNAPPPMVTATSANGINQLSSFALMQRPQPILPAVTFVDEIRVGTTWASVTPPAVADLAVSVGNVPSQLHEGDLLTVPITVTNLGPDIANDVELRFSIPTGLVLGDQDICYVQGSNVTCTVNTLATGATFNVQAVFEFNPQTVTTDDSAPWVAFQVSAHEHDPAITNNQALIAVTIVPNLDFGDARLVLPGSYPVTRAENGARHRNGSVFHLGTAFDREADGVHSALADADDLAGVPDDEDGVTIPSPLLAGGTYNIMVNVPVAGFLDAFFDFNNDGDWVDAGERVTPSGGLPIGPGIVPVPVTVPITAPNSSPHARFRFSDVGGLASTGFHPVGEVEDYQIEIRQVDFGNAPDSPYPTLLVNNGARHIVDPAWHLGATEDWEPDGPDGAPVMDQDGVVFVTPLAKGTVASAMVTASIAGQLDAFIDFNGNGIWEDPVERITAAAGTPLAAGINIVSFTIPAGATAGNTWSRFRFSSTGGLLPTGPANIGEVEDYLVNIVAAAPPVVTFGGLEHSALGNASQTITASGLAIWNLDSGNSVARINLNQAEGWRANISSLIYQDWDFIFIGSVGAQSNRLFTLPIQRVGSNLVLGADFSGLGATQYRAEFYDANKVLLASRDLSAQQTITLLGCICNVEVVADSIYILVCDCDWGIPGTGFPGGGPGGVLVKLSPIGPTLKSDFLTAVQISGGGVGALTLSSEELRQGGFWHRALGNAAMQGSLTTGAEPWNLRVGNIGSSGQDGIETRLDGADAADLTSLPWTNVNAAGRRLRIVAEGEAENGAGALATVELTSTANGGQVALGLINWGGTLNVWDAAEQTLSNLPQPAGSLVTITPDPNGPVSLEHFSVFKDEQNQLVVELGFAQTMTVTPADSPAVRAKTLRFTRSGVIETLDSLKQLWSGVGEVNLLFLGRDYGDAPDITVGPSYAYPTRRVDNGARHRNAGPYFSGSAPAADRDRDADGIPTLNADGDDLLDANDDEEGIQFLDPIYPGAAGVRVRINAPVGGKLDAWIDFNRNGQWGMGVDPEQIFTSLVLTPGTVNYTFNVPPGAVLGQTYARFRISTLGGLGFTGYAIDGEVQDLQLTIVQQPPQPNLIVAAAATPQPVIHGSNLTYSISVSNAGAGVATGVVVSHGLVDNEATWTDNQLTTTTSQGSCSNSVAGVVCNLGTLQPGATATIWVVDAPDFEQLATALNIPESQESIDITNIVSVSSAETDANPADNSVVLIAAVLPLRDFGDAPVPTYPTLLPTGARHRVGALRFGTLLDGDPNGQPVNQDDVIGTPDEVTDGFGLLAAGFYAGGLTPITIQVSGPAGYIDLWIDHDGVPGWGAADHVLGPVAHPGGGAAVGYVVSLPGSAVPGLSWARARVGLNPGGLPPGGYGGAGEVVDFQVTIQPPIDLEIAAVGSPALQIGEDESASLLLRVFNKGSNVATGVRVSATLPQFVTAQSVNTTNGTCQINGSNVICQLASVPPGTESIIAILGASVAGVETLPGNDFYDLGDLTILVTADQTELNPADNQIALPAMVLFARDWGDAPGGYPVLDLETGARHRRKAGLFLGTGWDREPNGTHSANADYDDLNGVAPDDEDGVTFTKPIAPGAPGYVTVQASTAGVLDAWVDFNADGDWADPGEQIFTSQTLAAGPNALIFTVPATATAGTTFSRWRFSETGGLSYSGPGGKGEVEDHQLNIEARLDLGDAPESIPGVPPVTTTYEVTLARDGARHEPTGLYLGSVWDAEIDGQPSIAADLDDTTGVPDDEDGWTPVPFVAGTMMNLSVYVTGGNGVLDVWVDWDHNYNWDAPEHQVVAYPVLPGVNTVPITVPPGIPVGQTYARFRLSTAGCPLPSGYAIDGEVEDYLVTVNNSGGNPNPVYFSGLLHTPQSGAALNVTSNGLNISNLEASNASVRIDLGKSQGWRASIAPSPVTASNIYSLSVVGFVGGQSNQPLGSMRVQRQGTSLALGADFSALGATHYVGRFYASNGTQIGNTVSNANLQMIPIVPDCPDGYVPDCEWIAVTDTVGGIELGIYICQGCLRLPDGTQVNEPVLCLLTPVNPQISVGSISAVQLRGTGGTLTLTSSGIRSFGRWHRFLGDAVVENSTSTGAEPWSLRVGNIGSSGQDGIETFFDTEIPLLATDEGPARRMVLLTSGAWQNAIEFPDIDSDPDKPSWRVTATGKIQDSANSFENLSDLSVFRENEGTTVTARFDGLGATHVQVDVFNAATLVGSTTMPVGTIGSVAFTGEVDRVGFFVTEAQTKCWRVTLNGQGTFTPANGAPAMTGNFLRFGAVNPQANVESLHSLITRAANVRSFTLRNAVRPNVTPPQLRLELDSASLGMPRLRWNLESDEVHRVEFRNALGAGEWEPLRQFGGASGEITFQDTSAHPDMRFYRLRAE